MSRLAYISSTNFDIEEEIPAYINYLALEADIATDWNKDEVVLLGLIFPKLEQLFETAEPIMIEKIFREQSHD